MLAGGVVAAKRGMDSAGSIYVNLWAAKQVGRATKLNPNFCGRGRQQIKRAHFLNIRRLPAGPDLQVRSLYLSGMKIH